MEDADVFCCAAHWQHGCGESTRELARQFAWVLRRLCWVFGMWRTGWRCEIQACFDMQTVCVFIGAPKRTHGRTLKLITRLSRNNLNTLAFIDDEAAVRRKSATMTHYGSIVGVCVVQTSCHVSVGSVTRRSWRVNVLVNHFFNVQHTYRWSRFALCRTFGCRNMKLNNAATHTIHFGIWIPNLMGAPPPARWATKVNPIAQIIGANAFCIRVRAHASVTPALNCIYPHGVTGVNPAAQLIGGSTPMS